MRINAIFVALINRLARKKNFFIFRCTPAAADWIPISANSISIPGRRVVRELFTAGAVKIRDFSSREVAVTSIFIQCAVCKRFGIREMVERRSEKIRAPSAGGLLRGELYFYMVVELCFCQFRTRLGWKLRKYY